MSTIIGSCEVPQEYKEYVWPKVFADLPRKGDKVCGMSAEGDMIELVVRDVIHNTINAFDKTMNRTYKVPSIIIRLKESDLQPPKCFPNLPVDEKDSEIVNKLVAEAISKE